MFTRFFSCFSDNTENQHIDLSRQSNLQPYIPRFNPESNVSGQRINFETVDFERNALLQNKLLQGQNGYNQEILQKFYYDQEDQEGIEETKITTASPSKNQLHKLQIEEMNPDLVQINQNNIISRNRIENADFFQQQQQESEIPQESLQINQSLEEEKEQSEYGAMGATDKQLNNYIQQASYLASKQQYSSDKKSPLRKKLPALQPEKSSTEKGSSSGSSQTHRNQLSSQLVHSTVLQNSHHSSTFRQSMDISAASSKVMFNAGAYQSTHMLDYQQTTNPDNQQTDINKTPKHSFTGSQKNNIPKKSSMKKEELKRTPQTDNKNSSGIRQVKKVTMNNNLISSPLAQLKKPPQQIKASILTKDKISQIKKNLANKSTISNNSQNQRPQQLIDDISGIILEERKSEVDQDLTYVQVQEDDLKVLDLEDGYQMDLGGLKSLNKRQTSKTEAFTTSLASYTNRKNKLSMGNPNQMKSSLFSPQQQNNSSTITQNMSNTNNSANLGNSMKFHKKTTSHVPTNFQFNLLTPQNLISSKRFDAQYNSTRNAVISKKNTTVSQDSDRQRTPSLARKRFSLGGQQIKSPVAANSSNFKNLITAKLIKNSIKGSQKSQDEEIKLQNSDNQSQREYFQRQGQNTQSLIGSIMSTPLPQ